MLTTCPVPTNPYVTYFYYGTGEVDTIIEDSDFETCLYSLRSRFHSLYPNKRMYAIVIMNNDPNYVFGIAPALEPNSRIGNDLEPNIRAAEVISAACKDRGYTLDEGMDLWFKMLHGYSLLDEESND